MKQMAPKKLRFVVYNGCENKQCNSIKI